MIASLRKKLGGPGINQNTVRTSDVIPINGELQKRFSHGVNFNSKQQSSRNFITQFSVKIIIRGDRNVGKTCLWQRLQGQQFVEAYNPTDEIQVTNIVWSYKTSDSIVKLDVWDVVDQSRRRKTKKPDCLKLDNNQSPGTPIADPELMICDATFVDVYKNCNGVILVFDITKKWSWEYVCRELDKIPSTIPVLLIANKVDLSAQREIREEEVSAFLASYKR